MDFTSALMYPFKSFAKVLTIVLVMTIAIAVFLGMVLNSFDWMRLMNALEYYVQYGSDYLPYFDPPSAMFIPGLIGLFTVMIVQGFWLSGYSVRVIRHVMDGYETLPNVEFGNDLRKGFYLFLTNILYGLLFLPFIAVVGMLMAMTSSPNGGGGLAGLVFCSAFLVAIPLVILLGWAYLIGMARFATEDERRVLFQIRTNLSLARQNIKPSLSLTGFMILLGLTFWFVSQFIGNALQLVTKSFFNGTLNDTTVLIIFIMPLMLSLAMNIIQEFSRMHLIAQYAYKIGIYDTDDEFDFV